MSIGCNACGVTGCRIIDSPRERLIAILTSSLVPCNGKFPTLIALITLFFVGGRSGLLASLDQVLSPRAPNPPEKTGAKSWGLKSCLWGWKDEIGRASCRERV